MALGGLKGGSAWCSEAGVGWGVGVGGLAKPLGLPMTGCVQQQEHVMHGVCRAWVGSLYCFGCSVRVWPLVEEWYDRPAVVGCAMCAALVVLVAWWLGRRLAPQAPAAAGAFTCSCPP